MVKNGPRRVISLLAASFALLGSVAHGAAASSGSTELVSISTDGQQGNDISGRFAGPAINGNGQVVAFDSIATTLVPNDTNAVADVFVHDRSTSTTDRVSVGSTGNQANGTSTRPVLDSSGTLVAFDSTATNLVLGDTNQAIDVFVHDRSTGMTSRVSVSSEEAQGDSGSHSPSISADGRFVAFVSLASNLVPGDTNGADDIFVRDLVAGTTERVSLTSTGEEANSSTTITAISADGRWVAFSSFATNLVPGDTNGHFDVFIHDRETGLTERVSVSSTEEQADSPSTRMSVSGDGQLVAFLSSATNLVPGDTNGVNDIFVRDRAAGTTERISVSSTEEQADGASQPGNVRGFTASGPDITADGRFVAFFSIATNLVPEDTNSCPLFFEEPGTCPDAFVRDLLAGTTVRVNVATDGAQANDRTADPVISDDGMVVAFFSAAGNLVPGDTNTCPLFTDFPGNCPDIFVHDVGTNGGGQEADLAVTKGDSRDPIAVGARLTYRIRVTNNGPDPATQVTLTDDLPETVRFRGATSTAGSCALQAGDVVCALETIQPGDVVDVRIHVQTSRRGTIENTVSVGGAEADPDPANNSDVETTRVIPA
ncbi:MAG: calcium-binding protein [Actinomycetota bacterium]